MKFESKFTLHKTVAKSKSFFCFYIVHLLPNTLNYTSLKSMEQLRTINIWRLEKIKAHLKFILMISHVDYFTPTMECKVVKCVFSLR